ncbi:MAG: hypothetical protein QXU65_03185 [Sulfolobales archaeon]
MDYDPIMGKGDIWGRAVRDLANSAKWTKVQLPKTTLRCFTGFCCV